MTRKPFSVFLAGMYEPVLLLPLSPRVQGLCGAGYPEEAAMLIEAGAAYDRKFILAAARQNVFTDAMLQALEKIA